MKLIVALFSGIALLFIGIGWSQIIRQQRVISRAVPVRAIVKSSEVKSHTSTGSKGRRKTTYTPVVKYSYTFNGQTIEGNGVFPAFTNASSTRVSAIVAMFPPGKEAGGWHVPGGGQKSFLLREWDFGPYLFVLFPMIHFTVGMAVWAAAGSIARREFLPTPTTRGWYELPVRASIAKKRRPWAIAALAWMGIGGAAIAHYFIVSDRPYQTVALVIAPIYFAMACVPLLIYLRYWRLGRQSFDARLFVNTDTFAPGQTFDVRVEQLYRQHVLLDTFRIGLILDQTALVRQGAKSRQETQKAYEAWKDALKNEQTSPAQPVIAKATFTVPADKPAGTPPRQKEFPRFEWRVSINVIIPNAPDYRADFPLTVKLPVNA